MTNLFLTQDALAVLLNAKTEIRAIGGAVVGYPIGGPGQEAVWVSGSVDDWQQDWLLSNMTVKDESFVLAVRIVVSMTTADYTVVRGRLSTLMHAVTNAVAADWSIGGTCQMANVERLELAEGYDEGNRRRELGATVYVRCKPMVTVTA